MFPPPRAAGLSCMKRHSVSHSRCQMFSAAFGARSWSAIQSPRAHRMIAKDLFWAFWPLRLPRSEQVRVLKASLTLASATPAPSHLYRRKMRSIDHPASNMLFAMLVFVIAEARAASDQSGS